MKRLGIALVILCLLWGCEGKAAIAPKDFPTVFGQAVKDDREKAEKDFVGKEWEMVGKVMRMEKDNAVMKCAEGVYLHLYLPEEELEALREQTGSFLFTAKGMFREFSPTSYSKNIVNVTVEPAEIVDDTFRVSGIIDTVVNKHTFPNYEGREYVIIVDKTILPGYEEFFLYPPEGATEHYEADDEITVEGHLESTLRPGTAISQKPVGYDKYLYMDDAVIIE